MSETITTPLVDELRSVVFELSDTYDFGGKPLELIQALVGEIEGYDPRVTAIRERLATEPAQLRLHFAPPGPGVSERGRLMLGRIAVGQYFPAPFDEAHGPGPWFAELTPGFTKAWDGYFNSPEEAREAMLKAFDEVSK